MRNLPAKLVSPRVTIRVAGSLSQGHLAYLDQLVSSAIDCALWPLLDLAHLEELDHVALMYLAGTLSGLLGIGSGVLKVPAMDLAMHIPMKVSTATSNLLIGLTAAASAVVYFARGDIDPIIAGPVAIGVLLGATQGSKWLVGIRSDRLRVLFVGVLGVVAVQMIWKGIG